MYKWLKKSALTLFNTIVPFGHMWIANCTVKKLILKMESEYGDNIPETVKTSSTKSLISNYERSIYIKDKLEDKAKSNIISVTISTTLIMGAYGIISSAVKSQPIAWFPIITVLFFTISVIYMMFAGILSLQLLMDKNKVYFFAVDTEDIEINIEAKEDCYLTTQLNDKTNHMRNNYIFTSFACIRNALICLFVVMMLVLSSLYVKPTQNQSTYTVSQVGQIFFSSQAITYIESHGGRQKIESLVWHYHNQGKIDSINSTGLIDNTNNLFIKVMLNANGDTIILMIDDFVAP